MLAVGRSKVSFIVAAFNGADFLVRCLDSLLAQTIAVEVVVVDDGSTDGTPELLEGYRSRVTILRQSNQGVSAARNAGFAASHGELVCFLDQDDWVEPEYAERLAASLDADEQAVAAYGDRVEHSTLGGIENEKIVVLRDRGRNPRLALLPEMFLVSPGALLIRRSALERAGAFESRFSSAGEDWDLCLRLADLGTFAYVPQPLFHYRRHHASGLHRGFMTIHRGCKRLLRAQRRRLRDEREQAALREGFRNLYRMTAQHWWLRRRTFGLKAELVKPLLSDPALALWIFGVRLRSLRRRLGLLAAERPTPPPVAEPRRMASVAEQGAVE